MLSEKQEYIANVDLTINSDGLSTTSKLSRFAEVCRTIGYHDSDNGLQKLQQQWSSGTLAQVNALAFSVLEEHRVDFYARQLVDGPWQLLPYHMIAMFGLKCFKSRLFLRALREFSALATWACARHYLQTARQFRTEARTRESTSKRGWWNPRDARQALKLYKCWNIKPSQHHLNTEVNCGLRMTERRSLSFQPSDGDSIAVPERRFVLKRLNARGSGHISKTTQTDDVDGWSEMNWRSDTCPRDDISTTEGHLPDALASSNSSPIRMQHGQGRSENLARLVKSKPMENSSHGAITSSVGVDATDEYVAQLARALGETFLLKV